MKPLTEPVVQIVSAFALVGQAFLVVMVVLAVTGLFFRPSRRAFDWLRVGLRGSELWIAFVIALLATAGSLFFSEYSGFIPCKLCWYQRYAMYPLVPILLLAAIFKHRLIAWFALAVAVVGAGIATWSTPSAKNSVPHAGRAQCQRCDTCYPVCPTGAKYSPDFTWDALPKNRVTMLTETLVRRLEADARTGRITHVTGNRTDASGAPVEIRATEFVLAAGFVWSPHLLLLSRSTAFPNGLANRSGLVGRYLAGHRNVNAYLRLPMELFPGINVQHSLVSKQFMRPGPQSRYLRHDLRIWESSVGREPRLRADDGSLLLGDAMLRDWQRRAKGATARVRGYYDVLPDRDSMLSLDTARTNRWGDPMPHVAFKDAPESAALRGWQEESLRELFRRMAKAGNGEILRMENSANDLGQEHPTGGCRMGTDPATSVVDAWGRAHDHDNLWVAGAPTQPTASCCNGTLTFAAVGLRTASAIAQG